jgi:hypothetical protein
VFGCLVALQSLILGCGCCQPVAALPPPPLLASEVSVVAELPCPLEESCQNPSCGIDGERTSCRWYDWLKNRHIGCWSLDIGGSLRHRFEHQDNFQVRRYGDPDAPTDTFLLQRFRLEADLRHENDWRFFVQMQDARPFGTIFSPEDFALATPYWNPFDLRQAYLERQPDEDRPLGLHVGRQVIFYRDTRVWGPGEWGNVGRYSWDGARLLLETPAARVDLIYAQRVLTLPDRFDVDHYPFHAYGVYARLKDLPVEFDLFYIGKSTYGNDAIRSLGQHEVEDIHSPGFFLDGRWRERWDYGATFAYTMGTREGAPVSAYGGNARLGHTWDADWKPRLGVQYSFASGDPDPGSGRDRTFDGLFGAIDSMYGWMNIFAWKNLRDYQATASVKPSDKAEIILDWHYFELDQARDAWYYGNGRPQRWDPTGDSGRRLGHEVDLTLHYRYSDRLRLRAGYSHFFPGTFIRRTGTSPQADWVHLQTMWEF